MGALFGTMPRAAAMERMDIIVWEEDSARDAVLGRPIWQNPDGSTVPITEISYTHSNRLVDFSGPDMTIPPRRIRFY